MNQNKISWMIGGPQGSGIDSAAVVFIKACTSGGFNVFGKREYHSNIKGEHSYYAVRAEEEEIQSHVDTIDLLTTYDKETVELHAKHVVPGGGIIFDPALITAEEIGREDVNLYELPYLDLLKEAGDMLGIDKLSKLMIMKNTLAVSAAFSLLDYDYEVVTETIRKGFKNKKNVGEMNVKVAKIAFDYAQKNFDGFKYKLTKIRDDKKRIVIQGFEAIGIAKLVAGCRLLTYYPITPSADEAVFLESYPEYGIKVLQAEDELAAIAMVNGAAVMGARASTSTSGPGFSLMAEGIGWAGMTEQPIVVTHYQRGGPSTGLPTRHEQGDLLFTLHAAHGEFPRIVMAPGDVEEAFYDVVDSFNFAEKYQTPVIFIVDKHLANTTQAMLPFNTENIKIDRGKLQTDAELLQREKIIQDNGSKQIFPRYELTEDGVSPRSVPGQKGGIHWTSGDEHDIRGNITEDPINRMRMMEKRAKKLETASKEIPIEKKVIVHGPQDADFTIVSWGSTKGSILDGIKMWETENNKQTVNFLQIKLISPLPETYICEFLSKAKKTVSLEMNYSSQLATYIKQKTGIEMDHEVVKYNGRAISQHEVYQSLNQIINLGTKKVILKHGV